MVYEQGDMVGESRAYFLEAWYTMSYLERTSRYRTEPFYYANQNGRAESPYYGGIRDFKQ